MTTDWLERRQEADAFAALVVAVAYNAPEADVVPAVLEEKHPEAFADAVHMWSLAHPPEDAGELISAFDVRSGSGGAVYALARSRAGAMECQDCGDWVFKEGMTLAAPGGSLLLGVCRRCTARKKAAAGG